jgi:hypothetical protein
VRERVLQEVVEHAPQEGTIRDEPGRARRPLVDLGAHARRREPHRPIARDVAEDLRRIERLGPEREATLLEPRDLEQVVDEREQFLAAAVGLRQRVAGRRRDRTEVAVAGHLERGEHAGERRLEVVHEHVEQVVAHLLELAQLAHRVGQRVGGALELDEAPHPRAEHEAVVRLRQELVAAGLDGLHAVGRVVERRDEDDRRARRARVALEPPAHLEAGGAVGHAEVAGGHRHVEQADVRAPLERQREGARPVVGGDRPVPEELKLIGEQLHVGRHVVGDEDERRVGVAAVAAARPRARGAQRGRAASREPAADGRHQLTGGP